MVDPSSLPELTDDQRRLGVNTFRKACQKYADVADGEWNDELNKLAYKAGRRVARDVFTEEELKPSCLKYLRRRFTTRRTKARSRTPGIAGSNRELTIPGARGS